MAFAVFRNNVPLTVDKKNRLAIPAAIRKAMKPDVDGEGFYINVGRDGHLWLYGKQYYDKMAGEMEATLNPTPEQQAFNRRYFALTEELDWDSQGRVVLPEAKIKLVGLGKEVTLVGSRDHLELWNRAEWEKHQAAIYAEITTQAVEERPEQRGLTGGGAAGHTSPN